MLRRKKSCATLGTITVRLAGYLVLSSSYDDLSMVNFCRPLRASCLQGKYEYAVRTPSEISVIADDNYSDCNRPQADLMSGLALDSAT